LHFLVSLSLGVARFIYWRPFDVLWQFPYTKKPTLWPLSRVHVIQLTLPSPAASAAVSVPLGCAFLQRTRRRRPASCCLQAIFMIYLRGLYYFRYLQLGAPRVRPKQSSLRTLHYPLFTIPRLTRAFAKCYKTAFCVRVRWPDRGALRFGEQIKLGPPSQFRVLPEQHKSPVLSRLEVGAF
jgi:hypothetical protein